VDLGRILFRKTINLFIDTYKNTFNAVDEQSEQNNGEQDHVIKYAGSVSFYYQKKKIFSFGISKRATGVKMHIKAHKNLNHDQRPINFTKSNLVFEHDRTSRIEDVENKIIKGSTGFSEWMVALFNPEEINIEKEFVEHLVNFTIEGVSQRLDSDNNEWISGKDLQMHVKNFKNKRKDSNDFKEAVKVIQDFYDPKNILKVDQ